MVIGTGPSLTEADVDLCREAGLKMFGVNNAWEFWPHVHVTVNPEWWKLYMDTETDLWTQMAQMECWCSDVGACERWGMKHFAWTDDAEKRGLSSDPDNVALGHSSGFAALNIAYLMGCDPILLLGHDMKYPDGYRGRQQIPGGRRHYFGEYPKPLGHWPSVKVGSKGELNGLINCYNSVDTDVDIINVSPGSALKAFAQRELRETLEWIAL